MSPDQIGTLTALIGLLEKMGGWPGWLIMLLIIVGPWILILIVDRNNERRFLAQKQMYDNNVILLKETQSIAKDLKEIVILNTQTSQKLTDSVEQNQFCPMMRFEKKAKGVQP